MVCPQCGTEDEQRPDSSPGLEVTWKRTLLIWWSFVWRSGVWGGVGAFLVALPISFVMLVNYGSGPWANRAMFLGCVVGLIISVWILRMVLKNQFAFSEFDIVLLPRTSAPQGQQ